MNFTPDELVSALDACDVPFLIGRTSQTYSAPPPRALLASLASAPEARLRAAIIPLLLRHPEFAQEARAAAQELEAMPRQTLQCFYTATVLLQHKYALRLKQLFGVLQELPDLFSGELNVMLSDDVEKALRAVAARHASFAGYAVNWVGTYEHAAQRFLRHLETQAQWA